MKNKEILLKAIEKTEDKGYSIYNYYECRKMKIKQKYLSIHKRPKLCIALYYDSYYIYLDYEKIIFNHDFAKAFWGEDKYPGYCECNLEYLPRKKYNDTESLKNWEYYLQQLVLEKEPLKYLEKFL